MGAVWRGGRDSGKAKATGRAIGRRACVRAPASQSASRRVVALVGTFALTFLRPYGMLGHESTRCRWGLLPASTRIGRADTRTRVALGAQGHGVMAPLTVLVRPGVVSLPALGRRPNRGSRRGSTGGRREAMPTLPSERVRAVRRRGRDPRGCRGVATMRPRLRAGSIAAQIARRGTIAWKDVLHKTGTGEPFSPMSRRPLACGRSRRGPTRLDARPRIDVARHPISHPPAKPKPTDPGDPGRTGGGAVRRRSAARLEFSCRRVNGAWAGLNLVESGLTFVLGRHIRSRRDHDALSISASLGPGLDLQDGNLSKSASNAGTRCGNRSACQRDLACRWSRGPLLSGSRRYSRTATTAPGWRGHAGPRRDNRRADHVVASEFSWRKDHHHD